LPQFDHETTMGLTAAIFGLSTLLSSFQIYNVSSHIQEDHLQQLALFSEYGRMAVNEDDKKEDRKKVKGAKPFQRIDFLVRDWSNFDEDEAEEASPDLAKLEAEMDGYLKDVIKSRDAKDLAETREQITSCFSKVGCYLLPHPGLAVTKKKYTGSADKIDPLFFSLLARYCNRVFSASLAPKLIRGRTLTAKELGAYVTAYAGMFAGGAGFPEATTMLEATARANNDNARNLSVTK
jgi:atlastin